MEEYSDIASEEMNDALRAKNKQLLQTIKEGRRIIGELWRDIYKYEASSGLIECPKCHRMCASLEGLDHADLCVIKKAESFMGDYKDSIQCNGY